MPRLNGPTILQAKLVEAIADPEITTVAAAAKRIGVTRQSAHLMLTREHVKSLVNKRIRERTDKGTREIAASKRLRKKVSRKLDTLDLEKLDPIEVVAVARQSLEMERLEKEIEAKYPQIESESEGMSRVAAHTARCLKIGRYLERRKLRGTRVAGGG